MGPKSRGYDHPRSCDRRANWIYYRTHEHRLFPPQQFEIILGCTRVDFCTHASRSVDKFLPIAYRRRSSYSACELCTGEIDATCSTALWHCNFLPLDQPKNNAVPVDGNGRPAQPPGDKRRRSPHRWHRSPVPGPISWKLRASVKMLSLTKLTAIEFGQRSRTFSPLEAHRSRKSSPTMRPHRYMQAVRPRHAHGIPAAEIIE